MLRGHARFAAFAASCAAAASCCASAQIAFFSDAGIAASIIIALMGLAAGTVCLLGLPVFVFRRCAR